ncbi:elongation factor Ts, partial [Gemmatimonadota bacterium]
MEVNCETDFVARTEDFQGFCTEVAMHIAATAPRFISREEVDSTLLDKEKEIYRDAAINEG